ncbi:MAG: hypothetical protein WA042_12285, partial [Blautia wexlerae]
TVQVLSHHRTDIDHKVLHQWPYRSSFPNITPLLSDESSRFVNHFCLRRHTTCQEKSLTKK